MKLSNFTAILMATFIFNTFSIQATLTCDHMARATTGDQKNMALDIAAKFLELEDKEILSMKVSNYASWKAIQVVCLADIVHYATVEIENRDGEGRRCRTTLDLHTKDYFVAQLEYNREYKARNVQTNCFDENEQQREQRNSCDSMSQCPRKRDGLLVRDIYDNCSCKYVTNMVQFTNVQAAYEDFYNPNKPYVKPESIESPFK